MKRKESMGHNELVEGLRTNSDAAWRAFVDQYGKLIHSVAVRVGLNSDEIDDHFQGVCLSVLRSIGKLRDSRYLVSWVYKIAYRAAIDSRRRKRDSVPVDSYSEAESTALQVEPSIIEEMQQLQTVAQLMDSLDELDPKCGRLLKLLFLAEPQLSYEEISRKEDLPLGSIGPNRARCLEKLQKIYFRLSKQDPRASASLKPTNVSAPPKDAQQE